MKVDLITFKLALFLKIEKKHLIILKSQESKGRETSTIQDKSYKISIKL